MTSTAFSGQSRLIRSRAVHAALQGEFLDGLHALSLDLRSPAESLPATAKARLKINMTCYL